MNRLPMSPAASALLRCLIGRARAPDDRILLSEVTSVDWRSLTFTGERHQFELRITGKDPHLVIERMCHGLEDAEFSIPGIIVADVALAGAPARSPDGSTTITIEALTVVAD
jgi:regulation of enolase protein 1 (concanavalin A-like superfamily)